MRGRLPYIASRQLAFLSDIFPYICNSLAAQHHANSTLHSLPKFRSNSVGQSAPVALPCVGTYSLSLSWPCQSLALPVA
jgi:hypothetical protein